MTDRRMNRNARLTRSGRAAQHGRASRDIPRSLFVTDGPDPDEIDVEFHELGDSALAKGADPTLH